MLYMRGRLQVVAVDQVHDVRHDGVSGRLGSLAHHACTHEVWPAGWQRHVCVHSNWTPCALPTGCSAGLVDMQCLETNLERLMLGRTP